MAHPQSSPRGLWAKTIIVPKSGFLRFEDYSVTNNLVSGNSTGLVVLGKIRVSNAQYIGANSTGFLLTKNTSVLPTTRVQGGLALIRTGATTMLAYHSTATTWKYIAGTAVLK